VGRHQRDEFALVLATLRARRRPIVARKVLDSLAARSSSASTSVRFGERRHPIYPGDADDADTLLKNRRQPAMYRPRRQGATAFASYQDDELALQHRLQLAVELRRAIERGEFRLHYQPKIYLSDGARICASRRCALQHPEAGRWAPTVIPVLERPA